MADPTSVRTLTEGARRTELLRMAKSAIALAGLDATISLAAIMKATHAELIEIISKYGAGTDVPDGEFGRRASALDSEYVATPASSLDALDDIHRDIYMNLEPAISKLINRGLAKFEPKDPLTEDEIRSIVANATKDFEEEAKALAVAEATRLIEERVAKRTIVEVHARDEVRVLDGVHCQFEELLYWLGQRENVYLYGEPGGGKTTAAKQAADALGLPFGYISLNLQTPESRLIGFMAPDNVTYRPTMFRQCYEEGGIFLVDEFDNMSDSVATSLNGALENGFCAFPDRPVMRHPDFVCIASGNTAGRGGNIMHAGRRALDAATLERFVFIQWTYDEDLEQREVLAIADTANSRAWLAWVREVRKFVHEQDIKLVASPRASFKGAKVLATNPKLSPEEIADRVLFKGQHADIKRQVLSNCPLPAMKVTVASRKRKSSTATETVAEVKVEAGAEEESLV